MWERLTEGVSATVKFVAGLAVFIYLTIGAVYFIAPSVMGFGSCKESTLSTTSLLPTTWLFWPVGVYNTFDLARRLDLPVAPVWIERWCPSHAEALDALEKGEKAARAGHDDEAARSYNKSTSLYPTAKAWYGLGLIAARQTDLTQAVAAYSKAIAIDPYDLDFYLKRGDSYSALGKFDEALADYNKVIAADPKHAAAFNNRGHIYSLRGDYAHAIADYSKAIELFPGVAVAYENLKQACEGMQTTPDYNKGGKIDPACAKAYLRKVDESRPQSDKAKGGAVAQPNK